MADLDLSNLPEFDRSIPLPERSLSRVQAGCLVFTCAIMIDHAVRNCRPGPGGFYWFQTVNPLQPNLHMEVRVIDASALKYKEAGPEGNSLLTNRACANAMHGGVVEIESLQHGSDTMPHKCRQDPTPHPACGGASAV